MVIQTGSPLPLASTIFCFRRWSQIRLSSTLPTSRFLPTRMQPSVSSEQLPAWMRMPSNFGTPSKMGSHLEDHSAGHHQHPHGGSDRPRHHELHGPRTVLEYATAIRRAQLKISYERAIGTRNLPLFLVIKGKGIVKKSQGINKFISQSPKLLNLLVTLHHIYKYSNFKRYEDFPH